MHNKSYNILSGFVLKIIALITMTFYHVGMFIENTVISNIFMFIGRMAFPLFIFLLVEGVRNTKNFGKYFLRLSVLELVILIGTILATFLINDSFNLSSPILELVLVAITLYLLKRKDYKSFLSLLPVSYLILCFVVEIVEFKSQNPVKFLPNFLRPDYNLFGLLIGLAFFYAKPVSISFLKSRDETTNLTVTNLQRISENILCVLSLLFIAFIYQLISANFAIEFLVQFDAVFAAIPILLYSGKRGYNAKWFQYGSYLYFPIHLVIIYLVTSLF